MARGRGGSHDFGVVTRRRYMSVDPELELEASKRTHRIAAHTNEDADSISFKSRNKDRDLLNDITQRLESNAYADPIYRSHYRPPQSHSFNTTTARKLPDSPLFIIAGSRRGGSVPPPRHRIDFYEEDDRPRIKMPPPPPPPLPPRQYPTVHYKFRPGTYRAHRAASEPPPFRPAPVYASMPRKVYVREVPQYIGADPYHYYNTGAPHYYSAMPNIRRRMHYWDLYDDEPEPVFRATYQAPSYVPSHHAAVRNARMHLSSLERPIPKSKLKRELGMQNGPVIDEPVVIHHIHTGPTARVVGSSRAPRATYRVAAVPPVDGSYIRHRSSSLPPSPKGVPRRSRAADIEARLECENAYYPEVRPESISSLRSKASAAKDKMDAHKLMMDRYLPIYLGPENEVEYEVDYKYGQLVNRMPSLDRHRPHQGVVMGATPITPYKPASTHKPPSGSNIPGARPRGAFRPKVSDTRQRIRDVICATKHDPHYYD